MDPTDEHHRHLMLFFFRKGLNAAECLREICAVYGPDALHDRVVRKWFAGFRSGKFDVENEARSGRPSGVDTDHIVATVKANPHLTVEEIQSTTGVSHGSVVIHLHKAGFVNRKNVWLPHELGDRDRLRPLNICDQLLQMNHKNPFLRNLVTGDEKWIVYRNSKRRRHWTRPGSAPQTVAKDGLHPRKVMLTIWWDFKGVSLYELLPEG